MIVTVNYKGKIRRFTSLAQAAVWHKKQRGR